jgi:class II aldolase/adducin N-terminal domain-containing protein
MKETLKFHCDSFEVELAPFPGFEELSAARQDLWRLGLLGADASGVGFGNVSLRDGLTNSFYITGTGTGVLPALTLRDYAKVIAYDFERNWLRCEGRAIASAESLTHAAIYAIAAEMRVVVHGHDRDLWRSLRKRGAATGSNVRYGTPEMAYDVQRVFRETGERGIFAMAGHPGGILAFGRNFREAFGALVAAGAESKLVR